MKEEIISVLTSMNYRGKYVSLLKKNGLWKHIEQKTTNYDVSDQERVYIYLNGDVEIICPDENKLKFNGITKGYGKYCRNLLCKACINAKKIAIKNGVIQKYGVDNVGKLEKAKKSRERFWNDEEAVIRSQERRKKTNIEKYGTENVFQAECIKEKIKEKMIANHGVDNPSKSSVIKNKKVETYKQRYGVDNPLKCEDVKNKAKKTSLEKYGVEYPIQADEVKQRMMKTKIKRGSYNNSNSSMEATIFFRQYIQDKKYDISQVAFSDKENGLHEWGYYFDRWYLYDFVAFEFGHRGNPKKILEIVEYNGPFHYTKKDVNERGNENAFPWKNKKFTIREAYERDMKKENYAREFLTTNYHIVWSPKYHGDKK